MPRVSPSSRAYSFGEFTLDLDRGALLRADQEIALRPKSFAVLRHLVEHHERLVPREELLNAIWGHTSVTDGALTQCLIDIRRALDDKPQRIVRTVPRRGYRFMAEVRDLEPDADPSLRASSRVWRRRAFVAVGSAFAVVVLVVLAPWREAGTDGGAEPAVSTDNSLAVLPFLDLSPGRDHEYLASGLSEEILNRLAGFPELRVVARTSSFAFQNSNDDVPTLSALLGVAYLLQGSLRREEQALRIAVQLVDRTGLQVWSQTFDRELSDIFEMQTEIAEAVALNIVPRVSAVPGDETLPDVEAYQHYLIGREILQKRPARFDELALDELDRAIEIDTGFAEAYAERAILLMDRLSLFFTTDYQGSFERARQDVDTALALRPHSARAHAAKALLRDMSDPGLDEAALRRALALDPNMVDARSWLSRELYAQGRVSEAIEELERAVRLDPLAPEIVTMLAFHEVDRGRFASALRRVRRLLAVPQPSESAFRTLWLIYFETGRLVQAADVARQTLLSAVAAGGRPARHYLLISTYGRLGLGAKARYWQDRYDQEYPDNYTIRLLPAWTWTAGAGHLVLQGRYDEALALMTDTLESNGVTLDGVQPHFAMHLGMLQAFTGARVDAVRTLERAIDPGARLDVLALREVDPRHVLAWCYQQTGEPEKAAEILARLETEFLRVQAEGRLHRGSRLYLFAQNALLMANHDAAVERLQQAVDAGWRDYYRIAHDPRWHALRDKDGFRALLAAVKTDVDAQRLVVERQDAERNLETELAAAMVAEASRSRLACSDSSSDRLQCR